MEQPTMANATMAKFGYPGTCVAQFTHWTVLLRPMAVTLGSLVLAASGEATSYSDLPDEAFAEQAHVVGRIEAALALFCAYEKINYLMLMMVDPHVHFHVIPRYAGVRSFDGVEFPDSGWLRMPDLAGAVRLDEGQVSRMISALRECGLA